MSQHDGTIANSDGATVRSDIQSAVQALLTSSSGTSAPSTTYANMLWADTTNNVLKQRDAADAAWKIVDTLDTDRVLSKTAAYAITISDMFKTIECSTTSAGFTVTFPAIAGVTEGVCLWIRNTGTAGNTLTLDGSGAETINGAATLALGDGQRAYVVFDGSEWLATLHASADAEQSWSRQQYFAEATLTYGTNISWDLSNNQTAKVTLTGNATLDNPTNMKAGAVYVLRVIQDATGGRTLAYGSAYDWANTSAPVLTLDASAVDLLVFYCDGTNMLGIGNNNYG